DESNEELGELLSAMSGATDVEAELGDVLFSVVDLSRQLGLDAEVALRRATDRFEDRFRHLET
ncbi:MAG: MazG nucleotide pyrophosphohydrolase domain-containing protein, partial [Acidimicrobiia bacterium]